MSTSNPHRPPPIRLVALLWRSSSAVTHRHEHHHRLPPFLSFDSLTMTSERSSLIAAILIVSDTASQDASSDGSYGTLEGVFRDQTNLQWEVSDAQIIPDNLQIIQTLIKGLCDQKRNEKRPNLIVTTGGTGFATKDVTPEAVEPLLQKKAPGLV